VMDNDARRMRAGRPYVFTNLRASIGLDRIAAFVVERGFGRP
jgi:urease accessory protein